MYILTFSKMNSVISNLVFTYDLLPTEIYMNRFHGNEPSIDRKLDVFVRHAQT